MNTFLKFSLCSALFCIFNYQVVNSSVLAENISTARTPKLSFSDRCYFSRFACHCLRKPRDFKCASNGLTYRNKCAIHCYNKHCPREITVVHNGPCESIQTLPESPSKATKCDSDPCICTFIFSPVCGSNGITYSNLCTLKCAQRCDPSLQLSQSNPC